MPPHAIETVAFVSLGCPKNLVDSESMLGDLTDAGYQLVSDWVDADAIVINTCGFLEASREESLTIIEQAMKHKREGVVSRVVVAGCLVQRHRARMLQWAPEIDAMIGVFDRDRIRAAVSGVDDQGNSLADGPQYWIAGNALQAAKERGHNTTNLTVQGKDGKGIGYWEGDGRRMSLTPRHWTYLRISEGCNQNCAFCTIPSIRGKMRSKPVKQIIHEARAMFAQGAHELNLIGQDTTSFGLDIGDERGLVGMLESLNAVADESGGGWIRLMYAYPTNFTDAMIDAIASLPNIVNYIDMPLQHATDHMLTAMRRNVSADHQRALVEQLRERIPGLAIRTTLITGFPGETPEDHQSLLEFIEDVQFDALGVFQYSREAGTVAGTMDEDLKLHVPDEVKQQREADIMLLQQRIAFDNAIYVAQQQSIFDVLIDELVPTDGDCSVWAGRCYHQAPGVDSRTFVEARQPLSPGQLVRCRITGSDEYDLLAQPETELDCSVSLPLIG